MEATKPAARRKTPANRRGCPGSAPAADPVSKTPPYRVNLQQAAPFYFKPSGDQTLLTNDWGHHAWLSAGDFDRYLGGRLPLEEPLWKELRQKGFIRDYMDFDALSKDYRDKNSFLRQSGPGLHIFVATLRCNHKCLYCHSAAVGEARTETDMTAETADAALDLVFKSPNPDIVIEFQGGEPMLNWPIVARVVERAAARAAGEKRRLTLALVTNMSLMDEAKLDFLLKREVSLCTSLDGPADLHDKNRIYLGGQSQATAVRWLREISRRAREEQAPKRRIFKPNALMTTTRFSLTRWRDIVDEYVKTGLEDIFLRPLSPIGYAKLVWAKIGYSAEEFLDFYRQALDYIVELNLRGTDFSERAAVILLMKILRRRDPGHVDLRSPCGAAVGQLAYNYDGRIFTCDEGRMVAQQGEDLFQVGHVRDGDYQKLIASPACRVLSAASALEGQPACSRCVYKPYCGVCPVHNYEAQRSLWGAMPASGYCAIHYGIFDYLFDRLKRPEHRRVFEGWLRERKKA